MTWLLSCAAGTLHAQACIPEFDESPIFDVGPNFGYNGLVDLDEDGELDLLVGLTFLLGDGAGGFGRRFRLPTTPEVSEGFDVKAADFDLDGHLDLAVVMIGGPHLNFYFGRGYHDEPAELFDGPHTVRTDAIVEGVWHIDTNDFNRDGLTDLVGISIARADVMIVLNKGERQFEATKHAVAPGLGRFGNHMLTTGDFDGDGHADVATGFGDQIRVLFGDGMGAFTTERSRQLRYKETFIESGHRFRSADIDGDGRAEIFATGDEWVLVYLGSGIARSGLPSQATYALHVGVGVRFVEIADMNSDGVLDVTAIAATGQRSSYRTFLGSVVDGIPRFDVAGEVRKTVLSGHGSVLAVGDVDRDGAIDFVLTTEDSNSGQVFLNSGACRSSPSRGDANADGSFDIGDAVAVVNFLFGGMEIACAPAGEVNGDGTINLSDVISILNFLFLAGTPPVDTGPVACD